MKSLTTKQQNALYYLKDKTTTEVLFGGGAGGGKSFFGCLWLIEQCQNFPGTRWVMGRSKLKTLKETTLNTFFEISSLLSLSNQYEYNAQQGIIKFDNGSEIILKDLFLYPSDPNFDGLGSLEITGAFVDECNQITEKAWLILKSRIRHKLDEYGLIPKILGSCNPAKNWVYTRFYKPKRDEELPESRRFVQSLLSDNPHISKHYRENLLTLDKNSKERLLFGNWEYDDNPDALCDFDSIVNIWTNSFVETGQKYLTADIALYGSDKFVIGIWDGWRLINIISIGKLEADEVEKKIKEQAEKHKIPRSNIAYDADGLGSFLRGYLKGARPFHNGSKALNDENYQNLKTQCSYKLAEKINANEVYVATEKYKTIIIEELEQLRNYKADQEGKQRIMPKEKVKEILGRSPDFSDMMIIRALFELKQKSIKFGKSQTFKNY